MSNSTLKIALVAAMLTVAGCAKKPPKELPPAPVSDGSSTVDPNAGGNSGNVGGAAVPGSRADFVAQSGSDTVHFATDSHDVDAEAQGILRRQAQWLQKYPTVRVTIEGHCDERGTREYNLALGDRRANAAKNFLASLGVSAGRISVISYGKERPLESGSDEGAWAANRRAVTVVPENAPGL